jgi:hypothetical protein
LVSEGLLLLVVAAGGCCCRLLVAWQHVVHAPNIPPA